MARIAGINIPQNKLVHIGLTYIYGIGDKFSKQICSSLEIPKKKRVISYSNLRFFRLSAILCQNFTCPPDFSLNSSRVVLKRNRAFYYDVNGLVLGTAKRRGRRKVYFHNSEGSLIGYKVYKLPSPPPWKPLAAWRPPRGLLAR